MEPLSAIFLFIAILALFAALALRLTEGDPLDTGDMGPESVLNHAPSQEFRVNKESARMVRELAVCDKPPVMADQTYGCDQHFYLAAGCPNCGVKTPKSRHVPPIPLPSPAPEPKRRRKPRPEPKRETKPDTRKVERKGIK